MLALKHGCIHPTTKAPYIRSSTGGKNYSPEPAVYITLILQLLYLCCGRLGLANESALGCLGGISVWFRNGI